MDSVARKLRIHASAKNSRNKNRNRNRNKNKNQKTLKTPRAPPPSPATLKPPRVPVPKTPRTVQAEQIARRLPNKKTMVLQASSNNNNNNNSVNMSQEEFWDALEKEIGTSI